METKNLLKSLKSRLSWMLCFVMFLAVSQGAWAAYWTNTIYASNSEQKDLYYYSFEGETLGKWPGTKMTYVGCKDGKHYYSLNVTGKTGFSKLILNDGNGNQSANLNAPTSTNDCYDWPSNSWGKASLNEKTYTIQFKRPNSWSYTPHIHIFNGCGTFVDNQEMTAVTGASGWYSYELKTNNTACDLIFNNGGWNGQSNTKTGWTIADACFTCNGNNTDITTATCPVICTTPTASDFTVSNNTKTYNGSAQTATVSGKSGMGTLTVKYGGSASQTKAGTYAITVDVAAGGSTYCAATGISLGNFVINKANQAELTLSSNASSACVAGGSITFSTTGGSGDGAVTYAITSGTGGSITSSGGVLTATQAGTFKVQATRAGDSNYNKQISSEVEVTFIATPTAGTITSGDPVCKGSTVTLTVDNPSSASVQWQNSSKLDISDATNTSYTTPELQTSTDYYVKFTLNGCSSTSAKGTATVKTASLSLTATPAVVNPYTPVTLIAKNQSGTPTNSTWTITGAGSYFTESENPTGVSTVVMKPAKGVETTVTATANVDDCPVSDIYNVTPTPDTEVCN